MSDGGGAEHGARVTHVVICQCTNAKRDEPAQAGDLYDESDYFVKQRAYADAFGDRWYIQSALHGLLEPGEVIEPYDARPEDLDEPEVWAKSIASDVAARVPADSTIELLGGKAYTDPLTPALEARGFEVHEPLRGQRIGERKRSLKRMANRTLEGFA